VHRPFGQQLEDRGADIAALAASSSAAATATRTAGAAEAETAARIEAELEAAARAEATPRAEAEVGTRILLAQMITEMFAEGVAGLPTLLMKSASIAGPEAKAESAGRWGEWVGHR
jgi:hypothetical protein